MCWRKTSGSRVGSDLVLYGRATSSNVQAVMWGLAELGVPYERVDCGESFGGLDTPEFLAMNPHGRIPVLVHGGGPAIFESMAILRYLGAVFGDAPFWPADPLARAQIDKWAEWGKMEVANRFTGPIFWRVVRTPAARHDLTAIRAAVDRIEVELGQANDVLSGQPYIAGDALTLADIPLGHVLYRYFDIEINRRDFPALTRYYRRLCDRAAYREAVMVSYDMLRDTI